MPCKESTGWFCLADFLSFSHEDVYRLSRLRVKNLSKRRLRLCPEAEAAHFILSGSDKTCLKAQWINDYKGMLYVVPYGYCINIIRVATNVYYNI